MMTMADTETKEWKSCTTVELLQTNILKHWL